MPRVNAGSGFDRAAVGTLRRAFVLLGSIFVGLLTAAPAGAIVGGRPADSGKWTWQVLVDVETGNGAPDNREIFCGGTLIARDWVMTAAHCVEDRVNGGFVAPSRLKVRVGSHRRSQGRNIPASEIHVHPGFRRDPSEHLTHDIALVKLAEPVSEMLGTVAIPDDAIHDRIFVSGDPATALGWGLTGVVGKSCIDSDVGCPSYASVLQQVELTMRDDDSEFYSKFCSSNLSRGIEICAGGRPDGTPDKDICSNDSGGPLIVKDRGRYYQIGIVSSGGPACDGSRAASFTRVASFHGWIGDTIREPSPAPRQPGRNAFIVSYAVANAVGRGAARAAVDAIGGRWRARASAPASSFKLAGRDVRSYGAMFDTGLEPTDPGQAARAVEAVAGLFGIGIDSRVSASLSAADAASGEEKDGPGDAGAGTRLGWRGFTPRDLMTGSSFDMNLSGGEPGGGAGGWSIWGEGAFNGFESRTAGVSLDGDVMSFHLGGDYRIGRWLYGLAVGRSKGEVDFRDATAAGTAWGEGTVEVDLTNILPYVQWSPDGRGENLIWGTVGVGAGEAGLKREARDNSKGDIETLMIAGGARMPLEREVAGWGVALKADGFRVSSKTEALKTSDGTVQAPAGDKAHSLRLRGGMEFTRTHELPNGAVDARLELTGRLDDGYLAGSTGMSGSDIFEKPSFGAEVGGGIGYTAPGGLAMTLRGRYLVARSATAREEWGASARMAYAPAGAGRGLRFSVAPVWGDMESQADAMRSGERWLGSVGSTGAGSRGSNAWMPVGTRVRVDYGLEPRGGRMFVTPYTEASLAGGDVSRMRIGAKMGIPWRSGTGMELGTFVESDNGVEPTGVMLRCGANF